MKYFALPLLLLLSSCNIMREKAPQITSEHRIDCDGDIAYANYVITTDNADAERNVLGIADAIKDAINIVKSDKSGEYSKIHHIDINFKLIDTHDARNDKDYAEFEIPYDNVRNRDLSSYKRIDYLGLNEDFWFKDDMSDIAAQAFCASLRYGNSHFCYIVATGF